MEHSQMKTDIYVVATTKLPCCLKRKEKNGLLAKWLTKDILGEELLKLVGVHLIRELYFSMDSNLEKR